jgi:hypothetical protein
MQEALPVYLAIISFVTIITLLVAALEAYALVSAGDAVKGWVHAGKNLIALGLVAGGIICLWTRSKKS